MDIGTSTTLTGYPHIHMLNGYSLPTDKSTVFKYMPLDRFVKMVDKKELVFVSPVVNFPNGPNVAVNIPAGQWHSIRAVESGSVVLAVKDGKYEPLMDADVLVI